MKVSQKRNTVVLTLTPDEARKLVTALRTSVLPKDETAAEQVERAEFDARNYRWWKFGEADD